MTDHDSLPVMDQKSAFPRSESHVRSMVPRSQNRNASAGERETLSRVFQTTKIKLLASMFRRASFVAGHSSTRSVDVSLSVDLFLVRLFSTLNTSAVVAGATIASLLGDLPLSNAIEAETLLLLRFIYGSIVQKCFKVFFSETAIHNTQISILIESISISLTR